MARKAIIARNEKRKKMNLKYAKKVAELKAAGKYDQLQKIPKNASRVRIKNRCFVTGRAKGFLRRFGMSRITFREQAQKGNIPGLKKSSW